MFPAVSVDVQSTVVSPTLKTEPDRGKQITLGEASTLSVAVGSVNVTTRDEPAVEPTVKSVGQLTSAGISSSALTQIQLIFKTMNIANI